jgi:hypothetical protein
MTVISVVIWILVEFNRKCLFYFPSVLFILFVDLHRIVSFQFACQDLALVFISVQRADFLWRSVFTVRFHLPVARVCDSQSVFALDHLGSGLLVASPVRDFSASVLCCLRGAHLPLPFFHFLCDSVSRRLTGIAL